MAWRPHPTVRARRRCLVVTIVHSLRSTPKDRNMDGWVVEMTSDSSHSGYHGIVAELMTLPYLVGWGRGQHTVGR